MCTHLPGWGEKRLTVAMNPSAGLCSAFRGAALVPRAAPLHRRHPELLSPPTLCGDEGIGVLAHRNLKPIRFKILGTGRHLPSKVLSNADLERMVDTSDQWIKERTGIANRRIVEGDTSTSDLAAGAVRAACEAAQIEVDQLDALIVATSTPDTVFPSTACWTQKKLGIRGMPAFDVSAGCTGWLYGLELASALVQAGSAKHVAVCGAEVMSKSIDWTDRRTCVLFGDGAGAAVVGPSEDGQSGFLSHNWGADGNLAPVLYQPAGGSQKPATAETVQEKLHSVHMEGNAVFLHAVRSMSGAAAQALSDAGLSADDIKLVVPHQANMRIIEATRERVGISADRVYSNLHKYGNMSAASVPVAVDEALREGRIEDGDAVMLTAFGTGLTWAASVMRW